MNLKKWGLDLLLNSLNVVNEISFDLYKTLPDKLLLMKSMYWNLSCVLAATFLILHILFDSMERLRGRKSVTNGLVVILQESGFSLLYITFIPAVWNALMMFGNGIHKTIKSKFMPEFVLKGFQEDFAASFPESFVMGAFFLLVAGIISVILSFMAVIIYYELIYLYLIGPIVMIKTVNDHSKLVWYFAEVLYRLVTPAIYLLGFKTVAFLMHTDTAIIMPYTALGGLVALLFLPSKIKEWVFNGIGSSAGKELKEAGRFAAMGTSM